MTRLWVSAAGLRRMLRTKDAVLLTAVVSLAIGFGLNSTLLSAMNNLVFAQFRFPDRDRLVVVWETNKKESVEQVTLSPANFFDLKTASRSFEVLEHFTQTQPILRNGDREEEMAGVAVTQGWTDITGVHAVLGRDFVASDYDLASPRVVILSNSCWKSWFGGDAGIIGKAIRLDNRIYTVVGVMPESMTFPYPILPRKTDLWIPSLASATAAPRRFHGMYVIGRMKSGTSLEDVRAESRNIGLQLEQSYPVANDGWSFLVVPLQEQVLRGTGRSLVLLTAASIVILLIACVNLTILRLSRVLQKRSEVFVRYAIGASRRDVFGELMRESIAVAMAGGIGGVVLGRITQPVWERLVNSEGLTLTGQMFTPNTRLELIILGVAILVGIATGILPALHATDLGSRNPKRAIFNYWPAALRVFDSRGILIVAQVALSTGLLLTAVALINGYWTVINSNFGRRSQNVLTARIRPPANTVATPAQRIAFYSALMDHVQRIPGISSVAAASSLSLPEGAELHFRLASGDQAAAGDELADFYIVTPGYFETIGARIIHGRQFSENDTSDQPPVVIVNETLARQYWPQQQAEGKTLLVQNMGKQPYTVVGVVQDIDHFTVPLKHKPELYFSFLARTQVQMSMLVYGTISPGLFFNELQRQARSWDDAVSVTNFATFEQLESRAVGRLRLQSKFVSSFAILALALTLAGILGVFTYYAATRRRELAIRISVGATNERIVRGFVTMVLKLLVTGFALGIFFARVVTDLIQLSVFGIGNFGVRHAVAVLVVVGITGFCGAYVPARRALSIDPAAILRQT